MRISVLTIFMFAFLFQGIAQDVAPKKYWIQFTDKAGSPFSIDHPQDFLSLKAIERREKQGVDIKENDIPVNPSYVDQVSALGARILNRSKWFNAITIELEDSTLLEQIQSLDFVQDTKRVARVKSKTNADDFMQDLMKMYEQYQAKVEIKANPGADVLYGDGDAQIKMLQGDKLHSMGFRGAGMTIAVLDAGFFKVNEFVFFDSLRNSGRLLGTRDFVHSGESVFDGNTHGLSVLSTMAANYPGIFVGTAPEASYWLIRTEDADTEFIIEEDNWVRGAEFADSVGADIINSSLGYTNFDDPETSHTYSQLDGNTTRITIGADVAASKGILVVNSAGNSGADSWKFIGAPADADSVLTIGAVDSEGAYASFSSRGPSFDGRVKPNVTAMGQMTLVVNSSGNVGRSNGTSFSSPVIAGMVACLWQAHPNATMMQVFKAIEKSASQAENPDAYLGFGIPNFVRAHSILSRIQDVQAKSDSIVNVYPNPFTDGVNIEFFSEKEQQITVNIFKSNGRKLTSEEFTVFPFVNTLLKLEDIKRLKAGNYVVSVQTSTGTYSRQIIKQE
ncbi:MAG: S8 family serine peptidase [Bacteroidia bacterium]